MKSYYLLFFILSYLLNEYISAKTTNETSSKQIRKIAIIGGGIGGTSCAYWLRKSAGDSIEIDLYNYGKIGGRIAVVEVNGKFYEAGASILHPDNLYMKNWAEEFGYKKRDSPDDRMGIYNGVEFVFEESSWSFVNYAKIFWRYGLDPFRLNSHIKDMLSKFSKIYQLQDSGKAFETMPELITAMSDEFSKQLNLTFRPFLKEEKGFHERFIDELAAAVINCNYGQACEEVNAFVGSVGLAGAVPNLWAVNGGNFQIPQMLAEKSNSNIISAKVNHITINPDGKYTVQATDSNNNLFNSTNHYDAVVLALPLISNDLSLTIDGVDLAPHSGTYQKLIATFVRGKPRAKTFGKEDDHLPDSILVSETRLLIKSLGKNFDVNWTKSSPEHDNVYKIFSTQSIEEAQLKELFEEIKEKHEVHWFAYPKYKFDGVSKSTSFKIADGIYHVNAIEWAASAMEMSAIGGRNVALLLLKDFDVQ